MQAGRLILELQLNRAVFGTTEHVGGLQWIGCKVEQFPFHRIDGLVRSPLIERIVVEQISVWVSVRTP